MEGFKEEFGKMKVKKENKEGIVSLGMKKDREQ